MGIKISIDSDIEKKMNKFQKQMIENLKNKIEEITPVIEEEVLDLVDKKLNEFFISSVAQFYADYTPEYYERRNNKNGFNSGMYALFRTKKEGTKLRFWFEPSEFISRTGYNGEDGLYKTVFLEGWHGGAMHDGKMLYRKPVPYYRYWGKEAIQTFSPYDMFIALKEDYEKRGFKMDYRNICVNNLNKIGFNVK